MVGLFKRLFGGWEDGPSRAAAASEEDLGAALLRIHRAYWTPAPEEKERLKAQVDSLSWGDLLRLHHLVCLDLLHAAGLTTAERGDESMLQAPAGPDAELGSRLAAKLCSAGSPFRPRAALIFQRSRGAPPAKEHREPDLRGELKNASVALIGALEIIRVLEQRPVSIGFVPFDELQSVHFGPPSLYPPARLGYEQQGRPNEVAFLPLLYGPSWFTLHLSDRDGTMTRFVCHLRDVSAGVGLGHQDFMVGTTLFGLGSIEAIEFPLDVTASDFEARCAKRGLEPAAVRKLG